MPLEALYPTLSEQIVPPMAVAEAQGVILYFMIKQQQYSSVLLTISYSESTYPITPVLSLESIFVGQF